MPQHERATNAHVSNVFREMFAATKRHYGPDWSILSTGEPSQVGLPLPSLALEYLLSSNVLYLGGIYGIAGPANAFKSTLGLEFGHIIVAHGGHGVLCETEGGKISPAIIESIYGDDADRLLMRMETTVEGAQDALTQTIEWFKKQSPKRDKLWGLLLDSLNGPASRKHKEQIRKDGHATVGYPLEAQLWDHWFSEHWHEVVGWPISFIFTNHAKRILGAPGRSLLDTMRYPGGGLQEFYASAYLHIGRGRTARHRHGSVTEVNITRVKDQYGGGTRCICVPFVVDRTGDDRLGIDWEHATAHLLADPDMRARVGPVVEVTSSSRSMRTPDRRFSCARLGLQRVTGEELGAAVHADTGLMDELRDALGVKRHRIWDGVMPDDGVTDVESEPPFLEDEDDGQNELWDGVLGDRRRRRRPRRRRGRKDGDTR